MRSVISRLASLGCMGLLSLAGCSGAPDEGAAAAATAAASASAAVQRPIEDFVARQGTYCVLMGGTECVLFEPPVANILGWIKIKDGVRRYARVDFAGLADRYLGGALGTTFAGGITERPLPDGRAEVTVRLHTRNALAWVWGRAVLPGGFGPNHRLWGHTATEVAAGAAPALVDSDFTVVFLSPAMGAPMPDLTQFSFDATYAGARVREAIVTHGLGELTADAEALGVGPAGPAELVVHQLGLFEVYANVAEDRDPLPNDGGIWNGGWPVELLNLVPVGR